MEKVFISADIEGCCGVTSWESTVKGGDGYEEARCQMEAEVSTVCEVALEMGYLPVVKDGHGDGMNLRISKLPAKTHLISGWSGHPDQMMEGIDGDFVGAIYLGYHGAEGSRSTPLGHTVEHHLFNWIKINGEEASEFTLNSLVAARHGVPSIMVSGDGDICASATVEVPEIVTVATKIGFGGATHNISAKEVEEDLIDATREVLSKETSTRKIPEDLVLTMNFKDQVYAYKASWYNGAKLIGDNTVEYKAESVWDLEIARMFMTNSL